MSIPRAQEPLGEPKPYIIPNHAGEGLTIPGTKGTVRILASAKETERQMSVFSSDGIAGEPVGFHYHNEAHDIFMCTEGAIKVWAGDQCRVLAPGDFASVPPGIIHSPQVVGAVSESIGLVTPGDWVDFFRFVSDKYDGVFADEFDSRNPLASLFPKFQTIKEKYDVIFQPEFVGAEETPWSAKDTTIPDSVAPYYLRANTGPRYLLGGVLSRPFITTKQCAGKFSITSIESSSKLGASVLAKPFSFANVHQVYFVLDGTISIKLDGQENQVRAGETVFVPRGQKISIDFTDNYVRFWSFSSGDGLDALVSQAGAAWEGFLVPDKPREVDAAKVADVAAAIGLQIEK